MKAEALENIDSISVTSDTSQLLTSELNAEAPENMEAISVTVVITGNEAGTLVKEVAFLNAFAKLVIPISPKLLHSVKYSMPSDEELSKAVNPVPKTVTVYVPGVLYVCSSN